MPITNISRVKTIAKGLNSGNSQIQIIYSNTDLRTGIDFVPNYKIISANCFIKNLKVYASVMSLPEAELPEFELEDSATTKRTKVLDIEWKSPRKQINLYIANVPVPNLADWLQVGSISLLNTFGYPFKVYNVMDLFTDNLALELGEDGKVGIQVQDVGHGLLTSADKVTVHGSYVEEIFVVSPDVPNVTNINVTGVGTGIANEPQGNLLNNDSSIDNTFLVSN